MPDMIHHCKYTKKMYGVSGKDIHEWMDAPCLLYGTSHRQVRHDHNQMIPEYFINKYGEELTLYIMHDHIIMDLRGVELSKDDIKEIRHKPPMKKRVVSEDSLNYIWEKIVDFQGHFFETVTGKQFTYEINGNRIWTPSKYPIYRSQIRKSLEVYPCSKPSDLRDIISSGSSYLWGILHNEKMLSIINEVLSAQKESIQNTYESSIYPETIIEI